MTRFIPFKRYSPYFKTGLNKALMESARDSGETVIFLAGWDRKCVNLGYSQVFEEEVNVEEFQKRDDVELVRRQGGGGATFLTPEGEITWGIVAPEEKFPDDVNRIYEEVCGRIAEGLEQIGIDAEHEPVNDVVTEKGKISGATLKREGGVVYIGGTLIYEADPEEMFSLLTPSDDKKKGKQVEDYRERVSSVRKESDASFDEAKQALKDALLEGRDFEVSELSDSEVERAEELADKYRDGEWLYRNEI
ncbi:MAG: biotin/lipoate A/B protein ligase family protein [Candidatus Nanohalobium sp.]